jgi:predicted TIM-barrel fold metal-dependent hydrolase
MKAGSFVIDVHAHFIPEVYRRALEKAGPGWPDGAPGLPPWDAPSARQTLNSLGVDRAILSLSSPGVKFLEGPAARHLARECNEAAAELAQADLGFGFFASLPLPDVDASIAELHRCLGELGAAGVALLTNYRGVYLHDPRFAPLWDELEAAGTVVHIHPTSPEWMPEQLAMGHPRTMLEFMFETTRAVYGLLLARTLESRPSVRVIISHAGAVIPTLLHRVAMFQGMWGGDISEADLLKGLGALHYDLAGAPVGPMLSGLQTVCDMSHVHFGSDYPYTNASTVTHLLSELDANLDMSQVARNSVDLMGRPQREE